MTPERRTELEESLRMMKEISERFYNVVIHTKVHTFIEFTGLLNEFIKICEQSLAKDIDFAMVNTHCREGQLDVRLHNTAYLNEKLNCIFDNCYNITLEPLNDHTSTQKATESNQLEKEEDWS
jgi:hypothetical protein